VFNIFADDFINYIGAGSVHAPVIVNMFISGLSFVGDLAVGSFTANTLQDEIDQMVKEIVVFKKGRKLKKNESWFMYDQEGNSKFNFLFGCNCRKCRRVE
jgi:hypothetical protein